MGSPAALISTTDSSVTVIGVPLRSNGCGGPRDLLDPRRPRRHSSEASTGPRPRAGRARTASRAADRGDPPHTGSAPRGPAAGAVTLSG
ncbi:hypothetical protein GCM10009714_36200 [Microlunatus capsulatus]